MGKFPWKDRLVVAFTSVLFTGYAPVASGTIGSLPAVGVAVYLRDRPLALLLTAVALLALGAPASTRAEKIHGEKDPGRVTIDEFVGMLIAFLWLPITWVSVVSVFVLFRLFDIWKPFPANRCERLGGGLGIMADDVVAGIYANVAFRILMMIF
jgi:phosphatidylglycerophosphatase A